MLVIHLPKGEDLHFLNRLPAEAGRQVERESLRSAACLKESGLCFV